MRVGDRAFWRCIAAAVVGATLAAATLAGANGQEDPLQGRILQRSDGFIYVYKDGSRYWVQPAPLSDDMINAIPEGGPAIERVDTFFIPPTPTPPPAPPPTPTPIPAPGTVLYQADWSGGLNGWSGGDAWATVSGLLVSRGGGGIISAPFRSPVADYAVEADLQVVKRYEATCCDGFGIYLRGNGEGKPNYSGGVANGLQTALISVGNNLFNCNQCLSSRRSFNPQKAWHTYRMEARGNNLKLLIDGAPFVDATDNQVLSGSEVGVWDIDRNLQINVRNFKVIAL